MIKNKYKATGSEGKKNRQKDRRFSKSLPIASKKNLNHNMPRKKLKKRLT